MNIFSWALGPLIFEKSRLFILDLVIALNFGLFFVLQSCSEIRYLIFAALVEEWVLGRKI